MKLFITFLIYCALIGVGYELSKILPKKVDGILELDMSDPDKDLYTLLLLIPTPDVKKRKTITFEVRSRK